VRGCVTGCLRQVLVRRCTTRKRPYLIVLLRCNLATSFHAIGLRNRADERISHGPTHQSNAPLMMSTSPMLK